MSYNDENIKPRRNRKLATEPRLGSQIRKLWEIAINLEPGETVHARTLCGELWPERSYRDSVHALYPLARRMSERWLYSTHKKKFHPNGGEFRVIDETNIIEDIDRMSDRLDPRIETFYSEVERVPGDFPDPSLVLKAHQIVAERQTKSMKAMNGVIEALLKYLVANGVNHLNQPQHDQNTGHIGEGYQAGSQSA